MSSKSYITHGFGFEVDMVEPIDVVKFIDKHTCSFDGICLSTVEWDDLSKKIKEAIKFDTFYKLDDEIIEFANSEKINGLSALFEVVAKIITVETGVDVCYEEGQDGCEGSASIIIPEGMPWHFNTVSKYLEEEDAERMMKAYAKELKVFPLRVDYLSIEYFG